MHNNNTKKKINQFSLIKVQYFDDLFIYLEREINIVVNSKIKPNVYE